MGIELLIVAVAMGLHDPSVAPDTSVLQKWIFDPQAVQEDQLSEAEGRLHGQLIGRAVVSRDSGLVLDGLDGMVEVGPLDTHLRPYLPSESMTVSAWVSVHTPTEWGGFAGVIQDNGQDEAGWLLGYLGERFCFALASGEEGPLTYLAAPSSFTEDRWYHLAGTYDGTTMRLWVDGKQVAESTEQAGPIRYPNQGRMAIGAYVDANEYFPLDGAIQHLRLRNRAQSAAGIQEDLAAYPDMRGAAAPDRPLQLLVGPYLQATQKDGITVMWETNVPSAGRVEYGPTADLGSVVQGDAIGRMHELVLTGLPEESNWFYRIVSTIDDKTVSSPVLTFQTKIRPQTPVGFIVVGDTQNNPAVTGMMSHHAWTHRPHFIMHCGDLVGTGSIKREWVQEFFGSTGELLGRYPIYPTLGNHERDARLYYDYFSLPGEEYFYDYRWGDVHVFVLDTNKDVSADSPQHQWLAQALPASDARWKIVQHHQPAWSSDSNDYGNTYQAGSTWGDMKVRRHLVPLYEQHGVDVVFNGHIHVYERTWPILGDRIDHEAGVVYVTTGGAGGSLEDFAPTRTWFTAHKYRGHHYCIVTAHEASLEVRAFDKDGKLIDFFKIDSGSVADSSP